MHDPLCDCRWCVDEVWGWLAESEARGMSLDRSGRVEPASTLIARVGNIMLKFHPTGCRCAECTPRPSNRFLAALSWVAVEVWLWTPWGQLLYWSLALSSVAAAPYP